MDPAGSGNDLIFPAQVALYGEPRDPREGSGPSPDPRPTSSLRPGPNANGPGHAFASPPSRRAIRGFPTGIRLLPPRYIPEKTFPARGTSAQSFTPPTKLPTFPKRRSPSGAPGSVATGDLSYTREASSLHGMRKRPTNLSHARGASVTPSAGQPCKKPFPCGRHRRKRFSSLAPPPFLRARGYIAQYFDSIRRILPFLRARGAYTATPSGAFRSSPFLRAWGGLLRPFRIKRQCAHFPTRAGHQGKAAGVRFFADLSYARGYCHLFPPRLSPHEGRARNREARQHHAGPFRAGPFRLRGKVRVPLPFGSGLPVCRVLPPPRSGTDGFCPPPGGSSASARFPHSRSFHRYSAAFTRRHTVPDRPHSGRGAGSDRH